MNQLHAIYWFNALSTAAWSLINIFVPIYFLTLGFSPKAVFVFYGLNGIAIFVFCVIAGYFCSRLGMKKLLLMSFLFNFIFIAMLFWLGKYPQIFLISAIIYAANVALYCFPLHFFFIKNSDDRKVGNDTGKLFAFQQIAALIGPLIGGLIAAAGGFPLLIVTTGLLCLVASFLLVFIEDASPRISVGLVPIIRFIKRYPRYVLAEAANSFQKSLEGIILPIFIFLIFHNIFSIGLIGSALALGGIFFTLAIGRRFDRTNKRGVIATGAIIAAAIWLARLFIRGEAEFYATTLAMGFFALLICVPLTAYGYSVAKKENVVGFIIFREVAFLIGRSLAFFLAFFMAGNLDLAFVPAAISNLFFLLL